MLSQETFRYSPKRKKTLREWHQKRHVAIGDTCDLQIKWSTDIKRVGLNSVIWCKTNVTCARTSLKWRKYFANRNQNCESICKLYLHSSACFLSYGSVPKVSGYCSLYELLFIANRVFKKSNIKRKQFKTTNLEATASTKHNSCIQETM